MSARVQIQCDGCHRLGRSVFVTARSLDKVKRAANPEALRAALQGFSPEELARAGIV